MTPEDALLLAIRSRRQGQNVAGLSDAGVLPGTVPAEAGYDPQGAARFGKVGIDVAKALVPNPYEAGRDFATSARDLWNLFTAESNPVTRDLTREEFMKERRKAPPSKDVFIEQEVDKARQSERYQDAGKNTRAQLENEARKQADIRYGAMLESQAGDEKRFEAEWQAELSDRDRRKLADQSQPFAERNPKTAAALPAVGMIASLLAGGIGMRKINKAGREIFEDMEKARKAGDRTGQAQAILAAESYAKRAPRDKLLVAGGAPLANVEARAFPEQWDAAALPPGAKAREDALKRMVTADYWLEQVPAYAGGVASTFTGAKLMGGKNPRDDIAGATGYLRGYDTPPSTQQLALDLAKSDQRVAKALAGPSKRGPRSSAGSTPAPEIPGGPPGGPLPGGASGGPQGTIGVEGFPGSQLRSSAVSPNQSRPASPEMEAVLQQLEQVPEGQKIAHLLAMLKSMR